MTSDIYSHLHALEYRLHNERQRLNGADGKARREFRQAVVAGVEREIEQEKEFLTKKYGVSFNSVCGLDDIDNDELVRLLGE